MELPQINSVGGRLRWARNQKVMTQQEVAEHLHVSYQAIEQVENHRTKRPHFLADAAKILEVPYEWLKSGKADPVSMMTATHPAGLPVYGYAAGAGERTAINDGTVIRREPRRYEAMGNDGFYLIVIGDSMEPMFEQGDTVAVSRIMPPRKRKPCIIEFKDGTAIIKRFISQSGTEVVCEQLNPKETLKFPAKDVKAVYTVVGHEF